jgi:hypothetical protein
MQHVKWSVHSIERGVGMFLALTKVGPAAPRPFLYRALRRLGILERLPWTATDSERLEPLPWGRPNAEKFINVSPPPGFEGPWPQSPVVDSGFSPPIINIGEEERRLNLRWIMCRYLGQILLLTPRAAFRALKGPRLVPISDERLARLFDETSFSQFICPSLDEPDRLAFSSLISAGEEDSYVKIDFSAIAKVGPPLPGVSLVPNVSLLKHLGNGTYRFEAIRIREKLFKPGDGPAWELAKYFVLQAAQLHIVILAHPRLHFPQDSLNAITRTMLPEGHILFKLLRPHGELTLGLHEAVIHHRRSVLHNSQREIYTPFPLPAEALHKTVGIGLAGIPGNSAYPKFQFGDFLPGMHTRYGRYRQSWFDAVYRFVSAVVATVPHNDPFVIAWADQIAKWIPGFPDGSAIFSGDALTRALTNYICAVSIFHTGDHHSFAGIPLNELPWRLRVPSPDVETPKALKLNAYISVEDFFRQQLCHAMFFKPVSVHTLNEVHYGFADPRARAAEETFRQDMKTLDERWANSTYPSSAQIAVSLQY